jgi:hypothetical protein
VCTLKFLGDGLRDGIDGTRPVDTDDRRASAFLTRIAAATRHGRQDRKHGTRKANAAKSHEATV